MDREEVQRRLRDNFARHIMGVTLYLQTQIMDALTHGHGHSHLRLGFEPYITLIGPRGTRLSTIAEVLQITRQAANQVANQIEAAGYIERLPDPGDRRAKQLVLTAQGRELRAHGTQHMQRLQLQFQNLVGEAAVSGCVTALGKLCKALGVIVVSEEGGQNAELGALLPRLRDYISVRLMQLTIAQGHPGLKQSFGQVLTAIGPNGGRIAQMARAHGVSKQAISAIATELEDMGYIWRQQDSADARQVVLQFTDQGHQLMADSIASVDELYLEFAAIIGQREMKGLCDTMAKIYRELHLEEDIFDAPTPIHIRVLAQQLLEQLGDTGAKALGKMLLRPTQG